MSFRMPRRSRISRFPFQIRKTGHQSLLNNVPMCQLHGRIFSHLNPLIAILKRNSKSSVVGGSHSQVTWGNIRGLTQRKSHSGASCVTRASHRQVNEETWEDSHRREVIPVLKVWQELFTITSLEETRDDSLRREAISLLKVWPELLTIRAFEETWEDSHRREAIPVHQVWQELLTGRSLEGTREYSHRREAIPVLKVWQELFTGRSLEGTQGDSHRR